MTEAFKQMDSKVETNNSAEFEGCTACVVLVTQTKIYCANAGDSRAVLYSNNKVVPLSEDHKPHLIKEKQRINDADHSVFDDRVDGNLAVARAFGDFRYKDKKTTTWDKQAVTANPDILVVDRKPTDKFIGVACDGIWDCLTNEQFCSKINSLEEELKTSDNNTSDIIEKVFEEIIAEDVDGDGIGTDNMTCIVVFFK